MTCFDVRKRTANDIDSPQLVLQFAKQGRLTATQNTAVPETYPAIPTDGPIRPALDSAICARSDVSSCTVWRLERL
jgi:hypothetical protein